MKKKKISIIGVRAYPAAFVGTSGLEFYVQSVVDKLIKKKQKNFNFNIYVKSKYQQQLIDKNWLNKKDKLNKLRKKSIKIIKLWTMSSKVFETVLYSFFASLLAVFDSSEIVWYQAVGPAMFSFLPKIFGKKIVLTVYAFDWQRKKWSRIEKSLFSFFAKLALSFNKNIFVLSSQLQQALKKEHQIKSTVALNGISMLKVKFSQKMVKTCLAKYGLERHNYILFLARLVPEKRAEWLIEAFKKIKNYSPAVAKKKLARALSYKNLKLVIAGGHGNMPEYEQELKAKNQDPDIIWTAYVFGKEKQILLAHCACFVLPSNLEGGNAISLLEAIAFSRYCVAAKTCTSTEIASLKNVKLFKSNNKRSFKNCLVKTLALAKKNNFSHRFDQEDEKVIVEHSWEKAAQQYSQIF